MPPASRVEDLDAYKLAVELRRNIVRLSRQGAIARDFKFVAQIRDAVRGGSRNIAEGFARVAPREFARFLTYGKASLEETKDSVVEGHESGYFNDSQRDALLSLLRRTFGAMNKLMAYLESPAAARAYEELLRRRRDRLRKHDSTT
jgi:four helix bundle protein